MVFFSSARGLFLPEANDFDAERYTYSACQNGQVALCVCSSVLWDVCGLIDSGSSFVTVSKTAVYAL